MSLIEDVKRAKHIMMASVDKNLREKMKNMTLAECAGVLVTGMKNLRERNEHLRESANRNVQEYELVESAKRLKESLAEFMGLPMPDDGD